MGKYYTDKPINIERLKDIMLMKNACFEGLAYALEMNRSTLYRKLRAGKSAITLKDYEIIKAYLDLTPEETARIFNTKEIGR